MAVLAQRVAVVGRRGTPTGRALQPGASPNTQRGFGARSSLVQLLLHSRQFHQRVGQLLLVVVLRHGRFLVLQRVDLLLEFLFLGEQIALGGIVGGLLRGADANQREAREQPAFAGLVPRRADRLALAGILEDGVLGRQALLRFVERGGLAVGVLEGFERADRFVLVDVGGRDRCSASTQ